MSDATTVRAGARVMNHRAMGKYKTTTRKYSAYNMPMEPGVYIIISPTGRYYIGRSINMRRRCLAHKNRAKANEEENQILNRSIRKYGWRMKYKVLLQTSCEDDAVYFEEQYIRMHWKDGKCMNAKTGDKITGDYNKDHKSKPVRYVHALTGGSITFDSKNQAARFFGLESRQAPVKRGLMLQETCSIKLLDDWNARAIDKAYAEAYAERCKRLAPYKNMLLARHEDGTVQRLNGVIHLKQTHGSAAVSAYYERRPCKGWLYRRAFEPWPTPRKSQVKTVGILVKATHVHTGQVTIYKSIMQAARELGVSIGPVYSCLQGEQQTTSQHRIERYR